MSSFFGDIYHLLFHPRSRSSPPQPPSSSSLFENPFLTPHITMNRHGQDYSSLMSPSESAISDDSGYSAVPGYFPSSPRSSMSSTHSTESTNLRPAQPERATTAPVAQLQLPQSAKPSAKLDAMSQAFPKPADDLPLEELLSRPPGKWSLGHYVKNARDVKRPPVDKEKQARDFEAAKRDLLRAKAELENLGKKR